MSQTMAPVVIYLSTTPSQVSTIGITSSGNTLTVNGKTANAVNSVSGSVSEDILNIDVNGVAGQVALPFSDIKENVYIAKNIRNSADLSVGDTYDWILFYFRYDSADYVFVGPLIYSSDKSVISSNGSCIANKNDTKIIRIDLTSSGMSITINENGTSNVINNPTLYNKQIMILKWSVRVD